jgi:hypothetical protein
MVQTEQAKPWNFDANALKLTSAEITARLRPLGGMHGLVIEKMGEAGSPVSPDRAFLNLEHYLEKGRCGEYFPRKLDHRAILTSTSLTVEFPEVAPWPVRSRLTYTFPRADVVDANLQFTFSDELSQFEVYFTSYFDKAYERSVRVANEWVRPEISDREQLLIPRDDKIAGRYGDGRWSFLKDRTRLSDQHFDLPVMVSTDDRTGWTVVQMIEPGLCTHIAPNRFAVGHNFIIGGWDVKKGDTRSARIRMIAGHKLTSEQIESAWQTFADECRKPVAPAKAPDTEAVD